MGNYTAIFKKEDTGYSVRCPKINGNTHVFTKGETFEETYNRVLDDLACLLEVDKQIVMDDKEITLDKDEFIVIINMGLRFQIIKSYRELTPAQRVETFEKYQELAEQDDSIEPFESFSEYNKEQMSLDMDFDTTTFECLG